jgi:hypothetical protein
VKSVKLLTDAALDPPPAGGWNVELETASVRASRGSFDGVSTTGVNGVLVYRSTRPVEVAVVAVPYLKLATGMATVASGVP